ncbi:MAG: DUF3332 family protein [Leptospira sp.]|nr:DUF3332 family protein [Leptospira sp.]
MDEHLNEATMKKKLIVTFVILLSFIQVNCFGKFAITQKLYGFVDGISLNEENGLLTKFVKTVVMWVLLRFFVAALSIFLDIVVFNLIEFWTGDNIIDSNSSDNPKDESISAGKTLYFKGPNGEVASISKSLDGKELTVKSFDGKETKEIIAFKDEPGKLYTKVDNQIQEIQAEVYDGEIQRIYSGNIQIPLLQN